MEITLALTIEDIDKENIDVELTATEENDKCIWRWENDYSNYAYYHLEITTDSAKKRVLDVSKGSKMVTDKKQIEDLFLNAIFSLDIMRQVDEADGFEHTDNPSEYDLSDEKDPYDPKLIRVDTKTFPIFHVESMIESGDLDLSPDFQREFVWTDATRKSRLIESLLLKIPIPFFYISQDSEGLFQVVDGIQRLSVIHSFMKNEFRLKNLEYLRECEGKWFKNSNRLPANNLSNMYTRRIEQTQLYFNIIDPQTPAEVKYDIFKRINTGGKSLNAQEIRNCLSGKRARAMIKEMAESEVFLRATRSSISTTRMADKEVVLRFIAFYLLDNGIAKRKVYHGKMDELLDETIDIINRLPDNQIARIKNMFTMAMENAHYLFGEKAFRKSSLINKSLFLSLSRVLYKYDLNHIKMLISDNKVQQAFDNAIKDNEQYNRAISISTNTSKNIELAYDVAKILITRYVQ